MSVRSSSAEYGKYTWIIALILTAALTGCGKYQSRNRLDTSFFDATRDMSILAQGADSFGPDGLPRRGGNVIADSEWKQYRLVHPPINRGDRQTVLIRMKAPPVLDKHPVLFLPGGSYYQSFSLFINGKNIYNSRREYTLAKYTILAEPHIIPIEAGAAGKYLYLAISTDQKGPFGLVDSIYISSEQAVINRTVREQFDRIILGFIFIFSGLIALAIFLRVYIRRRTGLWGVFSFFIMSLSTGLAVAFSSDLATMFFVRPDLADHVTLMSIVLFPVGLFLFIDQTIGPGYMKIIRRSWQIFLVLMVLALLAFIFNTTLPPPMVMIGRSILFLVAVMAALVEMFRAIVRGRRGARITSIGLLIFGFYAVSDALMKLKVLQYRTLHFHWGYLILMMLLGWLLYRRFEDDQVKLRAYSEELEEKSASLQELNRTLEERVQDRTEELWKKNEELNMINSVLADRNRIIENEIVMARKIQQSLIPVSDPTDAIASIYRPMDQVGGDFYDFIDAGSRGGQGIFISDVSGHGIPAALITSMVKTIILEAGSRREDPALLMTFINELLYGKTGGNFITAFYGIVDFDKGSLVWCSAGHNSPYLVSRTGIQPLTGKRSLPIGSFENQALIEAGKAYGNNRTDLAPWTKLLLYTDGLTEAVHCREPAVDFETGGMMEIIGMNRHHRSRDFVTHLYRGLVEFRGNDSFDDDVCIICVDIREAS